MRRALAGLPDVADLARPRPGHPWGFVDVADVDVPAAATAGAAVDATPKASVGAMAERGAEKTAASIAGSHNAVCWWQ